MQQYITHPKNIRWAHWCRVFVSSNYIIQALFSTPSGESLCPKISHSVWFQHAGCYRSIISNHFRGKQRVRVVESSLQNISVYKIVLRWMKVENMGSNSLFGTSLVTDAVLLPGQYMMFKNDTNTLYRKGGECGSSQCIVDCIEISAKILKRWYIFRAMIIDYACMYWTCPCFWKQTFSTYCSYRVEAMRNTSLQQWMFATNDAHVLFLNIYCARSSHNQRVANIDRTSSRRNLSSIFGIWSPSQGDRERQHAHTSSRIIPHIRI